MHNLTGNHNKDILQAVEQWSIVLFQFLDQYMYLKCGIFSCKAIIMGTILN